jgi:hypothetical protein
MSVPDYLQLPEPEPADNDEVVSDGYFPSVFVSEFEQNYQVTDVFQGKTRYMLQTAAVAVNSQLEKIENALSMTAELETTYRMCVYACAMMMICQRCGSVDTQSKEEFIQERKTALALEYKNEYRRLLLVLSGSYCEVT